MNMMDLKVFTEEGYLQEVNATQQRLQGFLISLFSVFSEKVE